MATQGTGNFPFRQRSGRPGAVLYPFIKGHQKPGLGAADRSVTGTGGKSSDGPANTTPGNGEGLREGRNQQRRREGFALPRLSPCASPSERRLQHRLEVQPPRRMERFSGRRALVTGAGKGTVHGAAPLEQQHWRFGDESRRISGVQQHCAPLRRDRQGCGGTAEPRGGSGGGGEPDPDRSREPAKRGRGSVAPACSACAQLWISFGFCVARSSLFL